MPIVPLSEVVAERVRWLWAGYIPLGYLTMLDGKGGLGKSTIMLDMAARLTRGLALPDGSRHEPMGVMLMMQEDGLADVVRPRLDNASADVSRVFALDTVLNDQGDEAYPSFPDSVLAIEAAMVRTESRVLLVDPIMNYFAKGYNTGIDSEVRQVLMPLHEMVKRNRFCAILLRHLNRRVGAEATDRGQGSPAFTNISRSALVVARDPDDQTRFALAQSKTNLAAMTPTLTYRLLGCGNGAARVQWEGTSAHDADALVQQLGGRDEDRGALAEAKAFLRDVLADGPTLTEAVNRQATALGIAAITLRRARESLGIIAPDCVKKARTQEGKWTWELPREQDEQDEQDDHLGDRTGKTPSANGSEPQDDQLALREQVEQDDHLDHLGGNTTKHTIHNSIFLTEDAQRDQGDHLAHVGGDEQVQRNGARLGDVLLATATAMAACPRCGGGFFAVEGSPALCSGCKGALGLLGRRA